MIGSTFFGHCYIHHQELTTIVLLDKCVRAAGHSLQPGHTYPAYPLLTSNQQQSKNRTAHVVISTIVVIS